MGHVQPKWCTFPNCTNTYMPHTWGKRKASNEGWFFQRNGDAWCPEHTPEWVESWRASRQTGDG